MELDFALASQSEDADDLARECQRRLQPIISEVVRTAVAAGWSESDILLGTVDVAWAVYEGCRSESGSH